MNILNIRQMIRELLKEQRKKCAKEFLKYANVKTQYSKSTLSEIYQKIINADIEVKE